MLIRTGQLKIWVIINETSILISRHSWAKNYTCYCTLKWKSLFTKQIW